MLSSFFDKYSHISSNKFYFIKWRKESQREWDMQKRRIKEFNPSKAFNETILYEFIQIDMSIIS